MDDLVRGTLQAQPLRDGVRKRTGGQEGAEGGRERDGGEAWVVQRGVSVCGYCQLRLELDVIDEATASLHGRGVGKHLGRMLEGMGKAVVVTGEARGEGYTRSRR